MSDSERHLLCEVVKSARLDEMYLYLDKAQGMAAVPEALRERFGRPLPVMTLLLRAERPLARVDVHQVMAAIRAQGFYLQMPPAKEGYLLDLFTPRDRDEPPHA
ncbi:YcgL domain-containing protein [Salinicola endophyticus]|uniref:YcgL domain-containing protein EVC62_18210 n=1 Tax=Salinicola endophyticus TaxID=1949083 RepID=A0ABY8FQ11_9GAMM|nr:MULTISPECIES: YcgL domain-containing protein [Salinicola]WFF43266.1 YcgL domain-containing protein [Salinicola endophyticus]